MADNVDEIKLEELGETVEEVIPGPAPSLFFLRFIKNKIIIQFTHTPETKLSNIYIPNNSDLSFMTFTRSPNPLGLFVVVSAKFNQLSVIKPITSVRIHLSSYLLY